MSEPRDKTVAFREIELPGLRIGLREARIKAIVSTDRLDRSQPSPESLGEVAYSGGTFPVFDLAGRLGLPTVPEARSIIVVKDADGPFGLSTASVGAIRDEPAATFRRVPEFVTRHTGDRFEGMWVGDHRPLLLLHPRSARAQLRSREIAVTGHVRSEVPVPPAATDWRGQLIAMGVSSAASGSLRVGVSAREIVEVRPSSGFTRVPGAAPWLAGMMTWRGHVLPLLSIAALLGLPAASDDELSRVVIVRQPGQDPSFAFETRIDAQLALLPGTHPSWEGELSLIGDFSRGVFEVQGTPVALLDISGIADACL